MQWEACRNICMLALVRYSCSCIHCLWLLRVWWTWSMTVCTTCDIQGPLQMSSYDAMCLLSVTAILEKCVEGLADELSGWVHGGHIQDVSGKGTWAFSRKGHDLKLLHQDQQLCYGQSKWPCVLIGVLQPIWRWDNDLSCMFCVTVSVRSSGPGCAQDASGAVAILATSFITSIVR